MPDESTVLGGSNRRFRLLLVSGRFPPSIGGLQLAGAEMARQLSRAGMDVLVATRTSGAVSADGYAVEILSDVRFPEEVFALSERWLPDVVLLNGVDKGDKYPFAVEKSRVPVVFRSHNAGALFRFYWNHPPFFGVGRWFRALFRVVQNARRGRFFAKDVFLGSRRSFSQSRDLFLSSIFHPRNVVAVPNAVESLLRSGSTFRRDWNISDDSVVFLFVANYSNLKGQIPLIRAFRTFSDWRARLVCIGSEPNESYRAAVAVAAGDDRILCLAGLRRDAVVDAINACDAAVLYSTQEAQPLSLLEAMGCSKPWICTDVGFVREMDGGIVLRRRNRRCLLDAFSKMMDPSTRESLGRRGFEAWRTRYCPEVVYRQWDALLRKAARTKPPAERKEDSL